MSELVGRTFGHYHILDEIGQGGVSSVYRALDLVGNRVVALKVVSPHVAKDERFKGRFDREVQLLSELHHPNIVPILAFGEVEGYHFIVMPFFKTGTLHDRLRAGPLTPVDGARLIDQVSSALDHAHQQGIVHRDIKPSNILLDEQGNALLSDFGFAQRADTSVNLTGSLLIGTPTYMSPEQCRGEPVDARSDQYSLGVILFQLATGRLPFAADTPMGVVLKQANEPLPQPRQVNPNLPEPVEAVIVKALAKDPAQRFASVAEMAAAFRTALTDSLDPSGNFRRRAAGDPLKTKILDDTLPRQPGAGLRAERRRAWAMAAALLAVLACAVAGVRLGFIPLVAARSGEALGDSTNPDFVATVHALSTSLAFGQPPGAPPGPVETSVAGTLAAWHVAASATKSRPPSGGTGYPPGSYDGSSATPVIPGGLQQTSEPTASPRPSETAPAGVRSPTPTRTETRTPSATTSSSPLPSPTGTPGSTTTHTPMPSRTPSPAATSTGTSTPTTGPTVTHTPTPLPTATSTSIHTGTPTVAPTTQPPPTVTRTPTRTPWPTRTRRPTRTPSPSPTVTPSLVDTTSPPGTMTRTPTPVPTDTPQAPSPTPVSTLAFTTTP